jgi:TolA-binding protein/predicted  nucleic acid-binding Zn-ribbon protein
MQVLEAEVDDVVDTAKGLEMEVAPGRARLNDAMVLQRYQDAVYLFLIGEHDSAAEAFFALVTTRALDGLGLHSDAEWYLAESLMEMGASEVAEGTYVTIAGDSDNPFREDAVRRLLEIYSQEDESGRFDTLYEEEILRGRVAPSDLILYAVAKAFHTKGEYAKAKSYFLELNFGSAFFTRAQYFLGAMLVQEGEEVSLRQAIPIFKRIAEIDATTQVDQQVADLALLALARIHYEFGELQDAVSFYGLVGGNSGLLDQKLHELVWTFIKQQEYQQALDAVDIFLLAYPEHRYASDLQLIRGHLLFRQADYDEAQEAYESVAADYAPVRDRFARMARAATDSTAYFEEVLELDQADLYAPKGADELPAYAVALMLADKGFARALHAYEELKGQDTSLAASEKLVEELSDALGSSRNGVDLVAMRRRVMEAYGYSVLRQAEVLVLELGWLADNYDSERAVLLDIRQRASVLAGDIEAAVDGAGRRARAVGDAEAALVDLDAEEASLRERLDAARTALVEQRDTADGEVLLDLARETADLEVKVSGLTERRASSRRQLASATRENDVMSQVKGRTSDLLRELKIAKATGGIETDADPIGARIDALYFSVDQAMERLMRVEGMLGTEEDTELFRIRATFEREASAVAQQREDLTSTAAAAEMLSVALVRENFERLEQSFAESVLGAEQGLVNVAWSQWVEITDERERVSSERYAVITELERRFEYLSQKMSQ